MSEEIEILKKKIKDCEEFIDNECEYHDDILYQTNNNLPDMNDKDYPSLLETHFKVNNITINKIRQGIENKREEKALLEDSLFKAINRERDYNDQKERDELKAKIQHEKELAIIRLREKEIELEIARLNAQSGENLSDGIDALIGDLKGPKDDG